MMFAKKRGVIKFLKDRCKYMAASSFVDGVTFCVFSLRNSACTSQRVFPRLYSGWGLATPESTQKKNFSWKNTSARREKIRPLPHQYVSISLTNVFAASSMIHTKTAENDKINWTWHSAYARAITSGDYFVSVFKSLRFHSSTLTQSVLKTTQKTLHL